MTILKCVLALSASLKRMRVHPGQRLQQALNSIHSGFTDELKSRFDPLAPAVLEHTYLTCVSEHRDDEDEHGRLSMWRAYGGATGVAIVMNSHAFVAPSDALNAWTTPVNYIRRHEFIRQLDGVADAVQADFSFLGSIPRDILVEAVARALIFAAVGLKHIGFEEEREWRVVHLPHLATSRRLVEDHISIRGIPQPIFKIPMVNYPEEGFTGAEPHELINRIIIGPTQYPVAVRSSLLARLYALKVPNPEHKIVVSGIPLRC
jgi:hypothetical protein